MVSDHGVRNVTAKLFVGWSDASSRHDDAIDTCWVDSSLHDKYQE
jgi:hypothetical protein